MSDIKDWSATASSQPHFPEGMMPSQVNDDARQVMAAVKRWYNDVIYADDYSTFAAACAAAANKTMVIRSDISLSATQTISASISVHPFQSGRFVNATGGGLNIQGSIVNNPKHQLFSGFGNGNVIISNGTVDFIRVEWWNSFADALTAASGKTLLISSNISLPAGAIVIPADVSLMFTQSGVISKGSATTITINGHIVGNPMHQIFSGFIANEVRFAANSCPAIFPQWWGASPSASATTNTVALQCAFDYASVIPVLIPQGTYLVNAPLNIATNGHVFGLDWPEIKADTGFTPAYWVVGIGMANASNPNGLGSTYARIDGIKIHANSIASTGFFARRVTENSVISNIISSLAVDYDIYLRCCTASRFENIFGSQGTTPVFLEGCNSAVVSKIRANDGTGSGIIVKEIAATPVQTIYGITTTLSGGSQVEVSSGGCWISNGDVQRNAGHGINLIDNSTPAYIDGIWFEDNTQDGVHITSNGNRITSNRIVGPTGTYHAVQLTSTQGNIIRDNVLAPSNTSGYEVVVDTTPIGSGNIIDYNTTGNSGSALLSPTTATSKFIAKDKVYAALNPAATISMDSDTASVYLITLTQNVTSVAFPTGTLYRYDGATLTMIIKQGGTGGYTITGWNAGFLMQAWSETGNTVNKVSVIKFVYNVTLDKWVQEALQIPYM